MLVCPNMYVGMTKNRNNIQTAVTNMTKNACYKKTFINDLWNVEPLIKVFYNMRCFVMFVYYFCLS